jgi:hypothetical protein
MKITFHHHRINAKGGTTVAMEEIPVDMFREMTTEHALEVIVGLAKCSKKDNYNKKIGRSIAKARMTSVDLQVVGVANWHRPDDREVREVVLRGEAGIFTLRHTTGNKTVHLMEYEEA